MAKKLSKEGRANIVKAQKARWAKIREAKGRKAEGNGPVVAETVTLPTWKVRIFANNPNSGAFELKVEESCDSMPVALLHIINAMWGGDLIHSITVNRE